VGSVEEWVYILDGDGDRRRGGTVLGVNAYNGILYARGGDVALPKILWDFLFTILQKSV